MIVEVVIFTSQTNLANGGIEPRSYMLNQLIAIRFTTFATGFAV